MMILRIICTVFMSLAFGPTSQGFNLNMNVTQTRFAPNNAQVSITWDTPFGVDGDCTITIKDMELFYLADDKLIKKFNVEKSKSFFQITLGCSFYGIVLSCTNLAQTYTEDANLFVGRPPPSLAFQVTSYTKSTEPFIVKWIRSESTDYIIHSMAQRTNSCHYILMGSQCSSPNEVLTQLFKGCTHSCNTYTDSIQQSVEIYNKVPYTPYIISVLEIQGNSIKQFCKNGISYEFKSSPVTEMQVNSNYDSISIKWSPPLHPGGFISHYVIQLRNLMNNKCDYAIISCQKDGFETYSRHNGVHKHFNRGFNVQNIKTYFKYLAKCKSELIIASNFSSIIDTQIEFIFDDLLLFANYNVTIVPVNNPYILEYNLDDYPAKQVQTGEFDIIQTSFLMNNPEVRVKWNNIDSFNGEYRIQYRNIISNDWNTYISKANEITLTQNLTCGSKYNIKMVDSADSSKTYFDKYFYVGKSPASIALSSKYEMVTGALVVKWTASLEFDYIVHVQSNSSCQYILMGPQCSVPNQLLVNSFKECKQRCREYNRSRTQRGLFVIDPNEKYYQTSLFVIRGNYVQEFCETTTIER